ncbi:nucleotidyltransferase [Candidatus Desantisbacteria bacterium CG_4_10_14_0_8_um_filter_48_22]|uniref:Nucleotidyltransferase n=1 Tax=Candidatus Desantisbacteria bacterium CG_4_10_14_0_8_um_filter_48_22 TaxID=1974543 RepID=A0A2M7SB80_9BACT|nr:MAG: nucleotidyltransferase [Candidatus Desantisbacteria bacterium CG_4_10_14_0_8_um_filter_48_22]
MEDLREIRKIIKHQKKELEEKFKVKKIAVFGSFVRGDQNKESDIDILVEFREPVGFLFVHLANYLEKILGRKVDLLTPDAIKPNRRNYIMEHLVYV